MLPAEATDVGFMSRVREPDGPGRCGACTPARGFLRLTATGVVMSRRGRAPDHCRFTARARDPQDAIRTAPRKGKRLQPHPLAFAHYAIKLTTLPKLVSYPLAGRNHLHVAAEKGRRKLLVALRAFTAPPFPSDAA
ncbi:MAG: hypothetical protein OXC93_07235 [Rhodospirillaceae bacterium]|nr:hypothetical protein [Rhodospirillaceae bacterium]